MHKRGKIIKQCLEDRFKHTFYTLNSLTDFDRLNDKYILYDG